MDRFFVIHYNELGLKKGNRDFFENRLCTNINAVLADCGSQKVQRMHGRLLLPLKADADTHEIKLRLAKVFGIAYFAEAWTSAQAVEKMEQMAWNLMEAHSFNSFRIDARRADKRFPHTSVEINQRVGAYVKERTSARVDLENAELTCWIEVRREACVDLSRTLARTRRTAGWNERKSRCPAIRRYRFAGGGMEDDQARLHARVRAFPQFSRTQIRNRRRRRSRLTKLLADYQLRSKIYMVPFAEVQRHIMVDTPLETRVILYRRYMMRLAERIARRERARVLVTGDSVGQVASQTIENIDVISRAV